MKTLDPNTALRELRDLVATYLEGSDDAPRAAELLDALEPPSRPPLPSGPYKQGASMLSDTFWNRLGGAIQNVAEQEKRERAMFGCTAAAIDEALRGRKDPRDIAMYAMGTLSNAQELICRDGDEPFAWSVRRADANTIRQCINIAKYAIDKAVPR